MRKFRYWLVAGTILFGSISPSFAYYSKTNYTEMFPIPPNASAFLIPLQGANVDTQAQFGSQAYLQQKKVAAKLVEVPHVVLKGSGGVTDYYVPSAKLFIVDRTPYNREWTDNVNTGTSTKQQGFNVESKDSLNVEIDVTIAASVSEDQAAQFFYNFGTRPVATVAYDSTVQYQSDTFYAASYSSLAFGRSLEDVMETVIRGKVQASLAQAFGQYPLSEAMLHKSDIIKQVSDDVAKYAGDKGITIEYVGYASGLNYDKPVQEAINDVFIAKEHALAIETQNEVMPLRQQIANVHVTENFANAIGKWNGATFPTITLPSFMIVPNQFSDWITNWFSPKEVKTATKTN